MVNTDVIYRFVCFYGIIRPLYLTNLTFYYDTKVPKKTDF